MMLPCRGVVRSCRTVESSNGYVMCICLIVFPFVSARPVRSTRRAGFCSRSAESSSRVKLWPQVCFFMWSMVMLVCFMEECDLYDFCLSFLLLRLID